MYDPFIGRFTTTDPTSFAAGDANLYRFEGDNPTNEADPSGLETLSASGHRPSSYNTDDREFERVILRRIGDVGSGTLDTPIANMLFQHSLQAHPCDLSFKDKDDVAEAMRKSAEYQAKLTEIRKKVRKGETEGKDRMVWNSGDLFYAFHGVDISWDKSSDVELKIAITDPFTSPTRLNYYQSGYSGIKGWLFNNTAACFGTAGTVQTFKTTVKLTESNVK